MVKKGVAKIVNTENNKVYIISSCKNDIDDHIDRVLSELENGCRNNPKLQKDYNNNPEAFKSEIIHIRYGEEDNQELNDEINRLQAEEVDKCKGNRYNVRTGNISYGGGNPNPFTRKGLNENEFVMTDYMERLFNSLNESDSSQKSKDYLEDKIDDGLITNDYELIKAIKDIEKIERLDISNKSNTNINVSASNNVNKKSIDNNNANKKVSKNKNNTENQFTNTAWYKEVIKPKLIAQLNQYELDANDRNKLKGKMDNGKIRSCEDLEKEYHKLIQNKEGNITTIKKTNRYKEELLKQLDQYDIDDIIKNRLIKKINKGQIQTLWDLEEQIPTIQNSTHEDQKPSNNKRNGFFRGLSELLHRR